MPPRSSYSPTTVRDFCEQKIVPFLQDGYVDRNNFRVENLEALRAFPDKAFKAFLARKVLQIPGSIAASVFNITTGLISQAEETIVTYSRSGQARQPNAYSRASRDYMTSQGHFKVPGYDRVFRIRPAGLLDGEKKQLFKNFARLAIVQNRGADVVNFQPRLVAGYMNETDALFFKNSTLPAWRILVANVMTAGSGGASTAEPVAYSRTNTVPLTYPQRNNAVTDLIAAGADRDQAQLVMDKLLDLGFNITFPSRTGNELSYRMFYYGQMSMAPPVRDVVAMMRNVLNLRDREVTIGVRGDDLHGIISFERRASAQTPASQSESTATPVMEYSRLMQEFGYSEMDTNVVLNAINERDVQILNVEPSGRVAFKIDVRSPSDTFRMIEMRGFLKEQWERMADEQGVNLRGRPLVFATPGNPNLYSWEIERAEVYNLTPASSSTQAAESTDSGIDPSAFFMHMLSLGYSEEFSTSILEELNNRGLRFTEISLVDTVVYGIEETNSFYIVVRAGAEIGDYVFNEIKNFFVRLYERNNYVNSASVTRFGESAIQIRFYHTEVHQEDSDQNTIQGVTRETPSAPAIEFGNRYRSDYEGLAPYLQATIPLTAYALCRSFGWLHSNIAHWCRELHNRNLKITGASTYTTGGRFSVRYMGLIIVRAEGNSQATGIRPNTWLSIVADSLIRAQGSPELRVMVADASYIQPSRFRRNPTRGTLYLPLCNIAAPHEYDLSESQHGETQPATQSVTNRALSTIPAEAQTVLQQNGWTPNEVGRLAGRLLVMDGSVSQVFRMGNTLKIEGRFTDRSGFYGSPEGLRDGVLVSVNNRMRPGNATATINYDLLTWGVEMRNIDSLGRSEPSSQTDGSQYSGQTGVGPIRFVGYQVAEPQRIFISGDLRFNWALAPREYDNLKSYLLYFWYETYGQFCYLSTGPMNISSGLWTEKEVLEQIRQDVPGKLKLYRDDSIQGDVARSLKSIIDGNNYTPEFTPVRKTSNFQSLEMTITDLAWADGQFFTDNAGRKERLNSLAGNNQAQSGAERVTDSQMRQVSEMEFTGTIGWEFEGDAANKTRNELSRFLSDNGTDTMGGYSSTYSNWDLKNDPSVRGQNPFEVASPVETGEAGIQDVLLCCRNLQKAGVLVNSSGGVHLHFGYRDWDLQHRKNILTNQITAENLFRATVPTYRRDSHNRWAQLLSSARNIQNNINAATTLEELNRASGSGRYWFINTRTGGKPTWEWRYPTATIEPDSTEMTIRLISKLIEVSKFGLLNEADCEAERMKMWLGEELGGFWINRMYELSTGSARNTPTRKPNTIVAR